MAVTRKSAPKRPVGRPRSTPAAAAKKEEAEAPAPAEASGKPVVELDELQIPGTLLSGKVGFPSGTRGAWQIDQMGRFAWSELSGQPTPEELQAFQLELTQILRRG